jgi:hypothetical protein
MSEVDSKKRKAEEFQEEKEDGKEESKSDMIQYKYSIHHQLDTKPIFSFLPTITKRHNQKDQRRFDSS